MDTGGPAELNQGNIVIVTGSRESTATRISPPWAGAAPTVGSGPGSRPGCGPMSDLHGCGRRIHRGSPGRKGRRKLEEITYDEMLELARLGAQVLNNRSVEMAKKYNVRLEVLSSFTGPSGHKVKGVVKRMENHISAVWQKDVNISRIARLGCPTN